MNDRPNFSATSPTVPLPQNGSRTSAPGGAPANIQGVTRVGRRRPAAIAGLVVSVVVGPAVDRVLQAWARPHVCQEGREGCLPRITDANASPQPSSSSGPTAPSRRAWAREPARLDRLRPTAQLQLQLLEGFLVWVHLVGHAAHQFLPSTGTSLQETSRTSISLISLFWNTLSK